MATMIYAMLLLATAPLVAWGKDLDDPCANDDECHTSPTPAIANSVCTALFCKCDAANGFTANGNNDGCECDAATHVAADSGSLGGANGECDLNECLVDNGGCHADLDCTNTLTPNPVSCACTSQQSSECTSADSNSVCAAEDDGPKCRCNTNFGIDLSTKLCAACTVDCTPVTGQFCVINGGTQECQCDEGFEVNGDACVATNGSHSFRGFAWAIMTLSLLVLLVK